MIDAPDIADADPAVDLAARRLAVFGELVELGMRLARAVVERAEAKAAEPDGSDPVLAFGRISRAVRLTVALHAKLADTRPNRPDRSDHQAPDAAAREAEARLEERRRAGRLRRAMTRFIAGTAIEAQEREAPEVERLFARLDARLALEGRDEAVFADIDVKAVAFAICQELGVDPGPHWWRESWEIDPRNPPLDAAASGGGGPRSGGGG